MLRAMPNTWKFPAFDELAANRARARQAVLTKPAGSLGMLEDTAIQLAGIQGTDTPASRPAAAILFASDHPVTRHGVSAYPSAVTAAMVQNFVAGGAAASVLARQLDVPLRVVDVGVDSAYDIDGATAGVAFRRDEVAAAAVGDIRCEDAMSDDVYRAALMAGAKEVDALGDDIRVLVLGEMGIGNTTVAAAIAATLLECEAGDIVGAGTGVMGPVLGNKIDVVREAAQRARGLDAHGVVKAVGGREIAALIGAAARAIERRITVLVDGFIVTSAMLALSRMDAAARNGMLFAHRSHERGHARVLQSMEARPLLDLGMRLGEGSGALTALAVIDLACALHNQMATFADANVPGPVGDDQ